MTTPDQPSAPSEEPLYVLMKRGYFYRPNAKGYTAKIEDAGRYTEAEAKQHVHPCPQQPVTMHLASEFTTASLYDQLTAERAVRAKLVEKIGFLRSCCRSGESLTATDDAWINEALASARTLDAGTGITDAQIAKEGTCQS